jgi:16S rRNA processing protein RimM
MITGRVVVGRIGRAHGIRGEVAVQPRTDDPDTRFGAGAQLHTEPEAAGPLTISSVRWHSGRLLVRFDGVPDRTAAEGLRGVRLLADVDPQERPDDPEEFYDHQLTGLLAVTTDDTRVGEITEVVHLPGHDLLAIRGSDDREILVPFVAQIVPEVDIVGGRVVIDPPGGLLDAPETGGT